MPQRAERKEKMKIEGEKMSIYKSNIKDIEPPKRYRDCPYMYIGKEERENPFFVFFRWDYGNKKGRFRPCFKNFKSEKKALKFYNQLKKEAEREENHD